MESVFEPEEKYRILRNLSVFDYYSVKISLNFLSVPVITIYILYIKLVFFNKNIVVVLAFKSGIEYIDKKKSESFLNNKQLSVHLNVEIYKISPS